MSYNSTGKTRTFETVSLARVTTILQTMEVCLIKLHTLTKPLTEQQETYSMARVLDIKPELEIIDRLVKEQIVWVEQLEQQEIAYLEYLGSSINKEE